MLGKLLLLWLVFGRSAKEPGQGGTTKTLNLKGLDGRAYVVTFFGDGTRLVSTAAAEFYTQGEVRKPIKVVKGDAAAVNDALKNMPE
jgi:hypothetical protein